MGGLRKYMPITFVTYVICMLALSGFPLTAGFFSKDEILLATYYHSKLAWALGTFAAFLTAFYMTRQICMVFFGNWRGGKGQQHGHEHDHPDDEVAHGVAKEDYEPARHGDHHLPHETPPNMTIPLVVLSFFALFLGWFGSPWVGNPFHYFLAPEEKETEAQMLVMGASITVGLLGLALGWLIYGRNPMKHADEPDPLEKPLGYLYTCLNRKWFIDELYEATIIRFTAWLGVAFRLFDTIVIDGTLHVIAGLTKFISVIFREVGDGFFINGGFDTGCEGVRESGGWMAKLQNGRIQNYFRVLALGVAILLVFYFLKLSQ